MKTLAIKLKRYGGSVSIVNNGNLQSRIFNMMIVCFGVLAVLYILTLGSTVINIIQRRSAELAARSLSTEVGDLELSYLSMSNKIDGVLGTSLGFKEQEAKFTTRKSLGSAGVAKNEI